MFISDDFPMTLEREHGLQPHYPPMAVGFGMSPLLDKAETEAKGYDVYKDVLFVKIATPGDRTSLYFQPATDAHKKRFPQAWAEFQKREQRAGQEGLPIEQWAMVSRSTALNLRVMHIHTVESLAALGDEHLGNIPNGRDLRERAKLFVSQRTDAAAATRVASEKAALEAQLTALKNQIAGLQSAQATQAANKGAPVLPSAAEIDAAQTASIEADVAKAVRRPRARA